MVDGSILLFFYFSIFYLPTTFQSPFPLACLPACLPACLLWFLTLRKFPLSSCLLTALDPLGPNYTWRGAAGVQIAEAGRFYGRGMRIDYAMVSESILKNVKSVVILGTETSNRCLLCSLTVHRLLSVVPSTGRDDLLAVRNEQHLSSLSTKHFFNLFLPPCLIPSLNFVPLPYSSLPYSLLDNYSQGKERIMKAFWDLITAPLC